MNIYVQCGHGTWYQIQSIQLQEMTPDLPNEDAVSAHQSTENEAGKADDGKDQLDVQAQVRNGVADVAPEASDGASGTVVLDQEAIDVGAQIELGDAELEKAIKSIIVDTDDERVKQVMAEVFIDKSTEKILSSISSTNNSSADVFDATAIAVEPRFAHGSSPPTTSKALESAASRDVDQRKSRSRRRSSSHSASSVEQMSRSRDVGQHKSRSPSTDGRRHASSHHRSGFGQRRSGSGHRHSGSAHRRSGHSRRRHSRSNRTTTNSTVQDSRRPRSNDRRSPDQASSHRSRRSRSNERRSSVQDSRYHSGSDHRRSEVAEQLVIPLNPTDFQDLGKNFLNQY